MPRKPIFSDITFESRGSFYGCEVLLYKRGDAAVVDEICPLDDVHSPKEIVDIYNTFYGIKDYRDIEKFIEENEGKEILARFSTYVYADEVADVISEGDRGGIIGYVGVRDDDLAEYAVIAIISGWLNYYGSIDDEYITVDELDEL